MKPKPIIAILSLPLLTYAVPLSLSRRGLTDVLLLDGPAFQDPSDTSNTLVSMEAYVFLHQIDIDSLTKPILEAVGDVGSDIDTAVERLKLFAAVGVPEKHVTFSVAGCSQSAQLPRTALKDLGLVTANVSIGECSEASARPVATVEDEDSSATIFPSGSDGFGVISDIDDTVKITHVLDKTKLIQTTLFDDPEPVPGMPELYASLASSLNTPQFIYVSGSPIQLYPFLRSFISTTFSASNGPLFLQNFTLTNPALLFTSLFSSDGSAKIDYKVGQINRIAGMYPRKSFLAIGDSTEKDPEVYAESFRIHGGDFIRCIWIHVVDGADNTDARFADAFEGVPSERVRLYQDSDIPNLSQVDVAGGSC